MQCADLWRTMHARILHSILHASMFCTNERMRIAFILICMHIITTQPMLFLMGRGCMHDQRHRMMLHIIDAIRWLFRTCLHKRYNTLHAFTYLQYSCMHVCLSSIDLCIYLLCLSSVYAIYVYIIHAYIIIIYYIIYTLARAAYEGNKKAGLSGVGAAPSVYMHVYMYGCMYICMSVIL